MIEQAKIWAIAAIVGLAAPTLVTMQPEAARAQRGVCGRYVQTDYFETQDHRVYICDDDGRLAMIVANKRTNESRWANATQRDWDRYSARTGSTEYEVDGDRLIVYQGGRQVDSERILGSRRPRPARSWNSPRFSGSYEDGYDEGLRMGRADRSFSYDSQRAFDSIGGRASSRYEAGFFDGYRDGYYGSDWRGFRR